MKSNNTSSATDLFVLVDRHRIHVVLDKDISSRVTDFLAFFYEVTSRRGLEDCASEWTVVATTGDWRLNDPSEYHCQPPGEPESCFRYSLTELTLVVSAANGQEWLVQNTIRYIRILARLLLAQSGCLFLHASMAAFSLGGVAFVGEKRSGKTSLLLASLNGEETDYVCNDDLGLAKYSDGFKGLGSSRSCSIRGDVVKAFDMEEVIAKACREHPANESAKLLLSRGEEPFGLRFVPANHLLQAMNKRFRKVSDLKLVVFSCFDESTAFPELEPLTSAEFRRRLLPHVTKNPGKWNEFLLPAFRSPEAEVMNAMVDDLTSTVRACSLRLRFSDCSEAVSKVRHMLEGGVQAV